ncbi:MAG: hypothetical protein ACRDSN_21260, partial [Pseudonocardiaceae bacterium]
YAAVVPDAGQARWLADLITGLADLPPGAVVRSDGPVRLVPADGGLLPHLTVQQNLVRAHRVARERVPRARAVEACQVRASRCGLDEDVLKRYPYEITPGRRRLAGVARALCAEAAVIVLEDAAGLPTWKVLLNLEHNPELLRPALLLITADGRRADGFKDLHHA